MSEAGSETFFSRITSDRRREDALAILCLTLLWALFFWRVLTLDPADQVAIETGDFSEQFYVFGEYQSRRLLDGEVPLWNPHNYGGNPFLADPQSGVFYPPRVITILLADLAGGWSFRAITLEAITHFWLTSLLMYAFVSRAAASSVAGIISAIIFSYGGFLAGYPITQLPLLESAT